MSSTNTQSKFLNDPTWAKVLVQYLREIREEHNFSYRMLSEKLEEELGVQQTPENLKNKLNRGNHGAQLMLMCLFVMREKNLNLSRVQELFEQHRVDQDPE